MSRVNSCIDEGLVGRGSDGAGENWMAGELMVDRLSRARE